MVMPTILIFLISSTDAPLGKLVRELDRKWRKLISYISKRSLI